MVVEYLPPPNLPAGTPLLVVQGYLTDPRLLYCPSSDTNSIQFDTHWNDTDWVQTYVGYPCWEGYRSASDSLHMMPGLVADYPTDSSDQILASDLITKATNAGQPDPGPNNHVRRDNTSAGGNVLFNDGSVRWRDISETQFRLSITGDLVYYINFYL